MPVAANTEHHLHVSNLWKVHVKRCAMRRLQAGMTSINDFATTYMCQSLPFGGVKESGFDRFAGVEGLRGLCVPKAVCQDRFSLHPPRIA